MLAPSVASADREAVNRGGLPVFLELALCQLYGRRRKLGRHLTVMAEAFERLFRGESTDVLLNNLPPGVGKSEVTSIIGPAWIWTVDPAYKFLAASYDMTLVQYLAERHRNLCVSDWYAERWGPIVPGGQGMMKFITTSGGYRRSASIQSGGALGKHGHMYLVDDPLKTDEPEDLPKILRTVTNWFDGRVMTRSTIGSVIKACVTMQRLHVGDISGYLLDSPFANDEKFEHIMLPYKYEPERADRRHDWRTEPGEVLWPENATNMARIVERAIYGKGGVTGSVYRGHFQQDPIGGADKVFDPKTFLGFEGAPAFRDAYTIISIDPTFTGGPRSDLMSIEVWGYAEGHFWMYYGEAVRRGFSDALEAIRRIRTVWPAMHVVIEASANGFALADVLDKEMAGVVREPADKSKRYRAQAAAHYFTQGHVHFDKSAEWYEEKARDLVRFPAGEHDDRVDTTSMAVLWLNRVYGMAQTMSGAMGILAAEHEELMRMTEPEAVRSLVQQPERELRFGRDVLPAERSVPGEIERSERLSNGWARKAATIFTS